VGYSTENYIFPSKKKNPQLSTSEHAHVGSCLGNKMYSKNWLKVIKGSNIVLFEVWLSALIFRENIIALIFAATNKNPSENLSINNQTVKNV
jgi:hypothetical protein